MKKIILIIAVVALASCKKNSQGGDAEIAAFPQHHGKPIKGCTLYVKFGAKDLPNDPTNNYSLKIVGEENEDHVHVENLRYGKYYLYAVGFDSSIMQTVSGGIAAKIKWGERKKEIDVNVPVTE